MKKFILVIMILSINLAVPSFANELISKSPDGAKVYFIAPKDGQVVNNKFKVQFGLIGMGVAPSGVKRDGTGHHHILIDTDLSTVDMTKTLPVTDKIKHFGGGQTETTLTLSSGKHTLQLLVGNYVHIPHDKPIVSNKITITVK